MPKRALPTLFATAFAAAALAMPPGALAQTHTNDEQNVLIESYVDTPEGCIKVDLFITSVTTEPPQPVVGFSSLGIYRASGNQDCATFSEGGFLDVIATGTTDQNPTEFTLDQRLRSGTLKTTMGVRFWELGVERPISIDLVLDGIEGTLSPQRLFDRLSGSGTNGPVIFHTRGYTRQTTASGSISDGTTNYIADPYLVKGFLRVLHTQRSGQKPRMWH
jgi:hypothetical protein